MKLMLSSGETNVKGKVMEPMHLRLKAVIERHTSAHRRFKELEEKTGVSAATWKTYWTRGNRPSAELIEGICKAFPQYAFWIGTGITDEKYGHVSAVAEETFPEGGAPELSACTAYFLACIRAKAEAMVVMRESQADESQRAIRSLRSVPRILGEKLHGAPDLDTAMDAVRLERKKRNLEVGLQPELEAMLHVIQFDYNQDVLLRLIAEYKQKRMRELI